MKNKWNLEKIIKSLSIVSIICFLTSTIYLILEEENIININLDMDNILKFSWGITIILLFIIGILNFINKNNKNSKYNILIVVSSLLFILPVYFNNLLDDLEILNIVINFSSIIGFIFLIFTLVKIPFKKNEEKFEMKNNKTANILTSISLVLFIFSTVIIFLGEIFILLSLFIYGVTIGLIAFVRIKYPYNKFSNVLIRIISLVIIFFIMFYLYVLVAFSRINIDFCYM